MHIHTYYIIICATWQQKIRRSDAVEAKKEPALREAERAESEVIVIFQRVYSSVGLVSPKP